MKKKTNGWIAALMPPKRQYGESEEVLCLFADGRQRVGVYCEDDAWVSAETGFSFEDGMTLGGGEVIAWRKLPKGTRKKGRKKCRII